MCSTCTLDERHRGRTTYLKRESDSILQTIVCANLRTTPQITRPRIDSNFGSTPILGPLSSRFTLVRFQAWKVDGGASAVSNGHNRSDGYGRYGSGSGSQGVEPRHVTRCHRYSTTNFKYLTGQGNGTPAEPLFNTFLPGQVTRNAHWMVVTGPTSPVRAEVECFPCSKLGISLQNGARRRNPPATSQE